jgi:hypothetical protein
MSERRVLKSDQDITLTEVAHSDGNKVVSRAYSVRARDPTSLKTFDDMGAAETYFEELQLQRLNPKK